MSEFIVVLRRGETIDAFGTTEGHAFRDEEAAEKLADRLSDLGGTFVCPVREDGYLLP